MPRPLKVAVVGQSFAAKVQLPALAWVAAQGDAPLEVVGLAGRDAEKARATAREHGVSLGTGDWRELLVLEPDLVLVSTPVDLHHEMVLAFLRETGAAVLCEKPFALDAGEARELVRAAEGRGAWIDHQLRFSPHLRRARELVRAGRLGEPWHLALGLDAVAADLLTRPWRWWYDGRRGGGALGALGSHLIDLVRFVAGEVEAVRCHLETYVPERADTEGESHRVTADEHATLDLRLASGLLAQVSTSTAVEGVRGSGVLDLVVTGRDGVVRVEGGTRLLAGARGALADVDVEPLPTCGDYGFAHDYGLFSRCLPLYLHALVRAIAEGRAEVPGAATFADGLATQLVLDAARHSHEDAGAWTAVA